MLQVHYEIALVELTEIDLYAMAFCTAQAPARMGRKPPK